MKLTRKASPLTTGVSMSLRIRSTMSSMISVLRASAYRLKSWMIRSSRVRLMICCVIDCSRSSIRVVTVDRT